MARSVIYYFSLQSPWAYIGHKPFMALVDAFRLAVAYRPVPLVDLFNESGGLPLKKRHPARQRYRLVELQRWRAKRRLSFHLQPKHWPFDARLADGVVIAAIQAGRDPEPYLRQAYAAIWEEERDLGDPATVAALADAAGLPAEALLAQAGSETVAAAYEQNRQEALQAGVFGSPAYVLDGEVFWGQDRLDLLADALESGRAPYRAPA